MVRKMLAEAGIGEDCRTGIGIHRCGVGAAFELHVPAPSAAAVNFQTRNLQTHPVDR